MKYALGLISLAFLLAPAAAGADDSSPPPSPPTAMGAHAFGERRGFHDMRQERAQFEQLRFQARTQVLGALTPAHRALLAKVVGQLAVAPNPDPRAAAKELDTALSPAETKTILATGDNLRTKMRGLFEAMRHHPQENATPGNGPPPNAPHPGWQHRPDAGEILLHLTAFAPPMPPRR
jgi:hypothetical protein